jgi:hemerythrin-like metal-binding protein
MAMTACNWTEALSTGNAMIDKDHRHMITLIDKLHEATKSGKGHTIIALVFEELLSHTASHFGREEKLMREIHYAGFARHKAEHDELIAELMAWKQSFESGMLEMSNEVFLALAEWLRRHIEASDQALGVAIAEARKAS